jgi:hypothetical protein
MGSGKYWNGSGKYSRGSGKYSRVPANEMLMFIALPAQAPKQTSSQCRAKSRASSQVKSKASSQQQTVDQAPGTSSQEVCSRHYVHLAQLLVELLCIARLKFSPLDARNECSIVSTGRAEALFEISRLWGFSLLLGFSCLFWGGVPARRAAGTGRGAGREGRHRPGGRVAGPGRAGHRAGWGRVRGVPDGKTFIL